MRRCRRCEADISSRLATHFLCHRCYGDTSRKIATSRGKTCEQIGFNAERVEQLERAVNYYCEAKPREAGDLMTWLSRARETLLEGSNSNG